MYGDTKNLEIKKNFNKNIKFNNYISYSYIPDLISKYKISLMPYQTEVSFSSKKMIDISKSMSPLKMFDYLASNTLLLATDLDVYKHILKNGFNCFLFKENNTAKDFRSVIEGLMELTGGVKLARSHSLVFGSPIEAIYEECGITHESSLFIPHQHNQTPIHPFRMYNLLYQVHYVATNFVFYLLK